MMLNPLFCKVAYQLTLLFRGSKTLSFSSLSQRYPSRPDQRGVTICIFIYHCFAISERRAVSPDHNYVAYAD